MDTLTKKQRSERMARIRHRNTKPEMAVRRMIHAKGHRYRLHATDLPGKPDIVFRSKRKVIFVHGCFWHRHDSPDCKLARLPKSNQEFWLPKLERNAERDRANQSILKSLGWDVLVVWECELRDRQLLEERIEGFLS